MSAPRVLVVRFSAIGDCIMTAWPVTSIRKTWPDAHLTWAVQNRSAPVIDEDGLIDNKFVFPRERWKRRPWSPKTWREQIGCYVEMSRQGFDYGLDFQGHLKTALCLRLAKPKVRLASRATDAVTGNINKVIDVGPEPIHEVERGYKLIRAVHDFPEVDMPIMPVFRHGNEVLDRVLDPCNKIITIQTGSGNKLKTYPAGQWDEVVERIARPGYDIYSIGGVGDPRLSHPAVFDKVGTWSIETAMAAVSRSSIHLASDTGTGHAAAAFGVPVVSVFGPEDPTVFRPWTEASVVLRNSRDPADVSSNEVVEATEKLMEGRW